jgi:hypothetical protein
MLKPTTDGDSGAEKIWAFPLPAPSRLDIKSRNIGVLTRFITRFVKASQFRGRITLPPGKIVPGDVPVTLPSIRYVRSLFTLPASRQKLMRPPVEANIVSLSSTYNAPGPVHPAIFVQSHQAA